MYYLCTRNGKFREMRTLSVKDYSERLRASVQADGRLYFAEDTGKVLAIEDKKPIRFCLDDDDTMYMVLTHEGDEDAFRIRKSGSYFYVPLALMFESLGVDYVNNSVQFKLIRMQKMDEELDGTVYRMEMSLKPKNKKGGEDML